MITEKERIVSNDNYEISKKLFDLFKKYKNYDYIMSNTNLKTKDIIQTICLRIKKVSI